MPKIQSNFMFCAVLLIAGTAFCKDASVDKLQGEWRFAYVQKFSSAGQMPAPPSMDVMSFSDQNHLKLKSTLRDAEFDTTCRIEGDGLSYSFTPPNAKKPVEHKFTFSISGDGKNLILKHEAVELVYLRPELFISCKELAGVWQSDAEGKTITMTLGEDGSYHSDSDASEGYFRLWKSPEGSSMTAAGKLKWHGVFIWTWRYETKGDQLFLTAAPINDTSPRGRQIWTKK